MLVNLLFSPNIIFVRLLQPENADSPIFLTPSGIVILAIPPHSANAPSPMLVTLSGIATLVKNSESSSYMSSTMSAGISSSAPKPLYSFRTPFSIAKPFASSADSLHPRSSINCPRNSFSSALREQSLSHSSISEIFLFS